MRRDRKNWVGWYMAMAIVNLTFAELYFLDGGFNWKFWLSDLLGIGSLLLAFSGLRGKRTEDEENA